MLPTFQAGSHIAFCELLFLLTVLHTEQVPRIVNLSPECQTNYHGLPSLLTSERL